MPNPLDFYTYTFIDNKADRTLFLLHGTGGTEHDFLFLDDMLNQSYNLVGLKGNVVEQGMNRFFARTAPGVFDRESIERESEKMSHFINEWHTHHQIDKDKSVYLGYSNGANMILALEFIYPQLIKHMVLLHPMLPFEPQNDTFDLSSHTAFVSYGILDQMIREGESRKIVELLSLLGADLTVKAYEAGHEVSQKEIVDVSIFLTQI